MEWWGVDPGWGGSYKGSLWAKVGAPSSIDRLNAARASYYQPLRVIDN